MIAWLTLSAVVLIYLFENADFVLISAFFLKSFFIFLTIPLQIQSELLCLCQQ